MAHIYGAYAGMSATTITLHGGYINTCGMQAELHSFPNLYKSSQWNVVSPRSKLYSPAFDGSDENTYDVMAIFHVCS